MHHARKDLFFAVARQKSLTYLCLVEQISANWCCCCCCCCCLLILLDLVGLVSGFLFLLQLNCLEILVASWFAVGILLSCF